MSSQLRKVVLNSCFPLLFLHFLHVPMIPFKKLCVCVCDFIGYLSVSGTSLERLAIQLGSTGPPGNSWSLPGMCWCPLWSSWGIFFTGLNCWNRLESAMRSLQLKFHSCIRTLRTYIIRNTSTQKYLSKLWQVDRWQVYTWNESFQYASICFSGHPD